MRASIAVRTQVFRNKLGIKRVIVDVDSPYVACPCYVTGFSYNLRKLYFHHFHLTLHYNIIFFVLVSNMKHPAKTSCDREDLVGSCGLYFAQPQSQR